MQNISNRYGLPLSWNLMHKEGKREKVGFLVNLVKKIALACFILLSLSIVPFIILYRLTATIKEKLAIRYHWNETLPAILRMKDVEEKNKFDSMKNVLINAGNDLATASAEEIAAKYTKAIHFNKERIACIVADLCKRLILRELSRHERFSPYWMPNLAEWKIRLENFHQDSAIDVISSLPKDFEGADDLQAAITVLLCTANGIETPFAQKLHSKLHQKYHQLLSISKNLEANVAEFKSIFALMVSGLQDPAGVHHVDPAQANRSFIETYRKLLGHPVYQSLKMTDLQPFVALLHDFAIAIWNDVHILDEYRAVGRAIIVDGNLEYEEIDTNEPYGANAMLSDKLKASQEVVADCHYDNDRLISKIAYAAMHFWQVMGTLASEGGMARHIPALFGVDQYDSHGTLSNNPSIQGTSTWKGPEIEGRVNNCYGGSPTIGDHQIAPEFMALLQAVENNLSAPEKRRRQKVPSKVIFNSLQNIDKVHGEGPRSRTIMLLNEAYPLSFTGVILAKDAPLYLMKSSEDIIWENSRQFGTVFKEKLMQGVNAPDETGHGFYFFGSPQKWEALFDKIINRVNGQFSENHHGLSLQKKRNLQAAYQDYVYSLLIAAIECQQIHTLNLSGIENPLITEITACKENIDRGGMENTKYMYLRLPLVDEEDKHLSAAEQLEYLVGIMNSRSISARNRAILRDRMPQILAFIEVVSPESFNQTLTDLLADLKLEATLTYAPDATSCLA